MCRNITILRGLQPPASAEEIEAAARQYVRQVRGATRPPAGADDVLSKPFRLAELIAVVAKLSPKPAA